MVYTYCLMTVSNQEELASGTFIQARAEALMMKSLTESFVFSGTTCNDKTEDGRG